MLTSSTVIWVNDAADSSLPGPDGTTAAAGPEAAEAVPVTVTVAPASAPASSTAVSLLTLPKVFFNAGPRP